MGIRELKRFDGSSTWQLELRFVGVEPFRANYDTREAAVKAEKDIKPRMQAQSRLARLSKPAEPPPAPPPTPLELFMSMRVTAAIDEYLDHKKAKSEMKRNGKKGEGWDHCAPTVRNALGSLTIAEILPKWALDHVAEMRSTNRNGGKGYALETINKHFKLIHASVAHCAYVRNVTAPELPFKTDKLFGKKWSKPRKRIYRSGELEALMAAVQNYGGRTQQQWGPLIELAIETGARMQELVLCYWHEVDFGRRVLIVDEKNCKTSEGREIPLSPHAQGILLRLRDRRDPSSPKVFHLFRDAAHATRQFRNGLAARAGLVDFHFHDHRHVATTALRDPSRERMDSVDVANMMGHSMETMRKVYDHTPASALARLMPQKVAL